MTVEELHEALTKLDKGVLMLGAHPADAHEFCALEFDAAVRGRAHMDHPVTLPDLRPLNDAFGIGAEADRVRTAAGQSAGTRT